MVGASTPHLVAAAPRRPGPLAFLHLTGDRPTMTRARSDELLDSSLQHRQPPDAAGERPFLAAGPAHHVRAEPLARSAHIGRSALSLRLSKALGTSCSRSPRGIGTRTPPWHQSAPSCAHNWGAGVPRLDSGYELFPQSERNRYPDIPRMTHADLPFGRWTARSGSGIRRYLA